MATIPAYDEAEFLTAHPRSPAAKKARPGLGRRMVRGLLSAAAYTLASLMLLATAPLFLVVSDRGRRGALVQPAARSRPALVGASL